MYPTTQNSTAIHLICLFVGTSLQVMSSSSTRRFSKRKFKFKSRPSYRLCSQKQYKFPLWTLSALSTGVWGSQDPKLLGRFSKSHSDHNVPIFAFSIDCWPFITMMISASLTPAKGWGSVLYRTTETTGTMEEDQIATFKTLILNGI